MDELISFKTAKLAKEAGFKEAVYAAYSLRTNKFSHKSKYGRSYNTLSNTPTHLISAPTQTHLRRWLREKHNISVEVWYDYEHGKFTVGVYDIDRKVNHMNPVYGTYEEVLEDGLICALKLVK